MIRFWIKDGFGYGCESSQNLFLAIIALIILHRIANVFSIATAIAVVVSTGVVCGIYENEGAGILGPILNTFRKLYI